MPVHVHTTDGAYIQIADEPDGFKIDTNVPFPGFFKVTCQDQSIIWFNAAHVIAMGELLEADDGHGETRQ